MNDVIYRHDAIDAVDAIGHIATMSDGDKCIRRSAVKYTLSMLPSAQPKIIRCKDCVHYHTDVFGGELGITGIWENIIVAHNACDKWTKDMNCVTPNGFCFLAERRVENADVNT